MITFPAFAGIRCLMMPYIQGEPDSVPEIYSTYAGILASVFIKKGDIGFLTIDESPVVQGKPHRGARAKFGRALHTEAGLRPHKLYGWGPTWGGRDNVVLDRDTRIILANSIEDSCAVWDAEEEETSEDGDIGYLAGFYPYTNATFLKAGQVCEIGILTPHESLPIVQVTGYNRQFLRIVGFGVHGREPYFTQNPMMKGSVN